MLREKWLQELRGLRCNGAPAHELLAGVHVDFYMIRYKAFVGLENRSQIWWMKSFHEGVAQTNEQTMGKNNKQRTKNRSSDGGVAGKKGQGDKRSGRGAVGSEKRDEQTTASKRKEFDGKGKNVGVWMMIAKVAAGTETINDATTHFCVPVNRSPDEKEEGSSKQFSSSGCPSPRTNSKEQCSGPSGK